MRIAYMLTSLGIGGAERQVISLAERIVLRGHEVQLIVLREPQPRQWPTDLETIHLNMRRTPPSVLVALRRARRVLQDFQPDLLHSHTFPANLTARLLRLFASVPRVLSTIHNVYEGGHARMLAYRVTDPLTVHTTAVSTVAAERFVQLKAVPRRKCSLITNGIDAALFTPSPLQRAKLRDELGAADDFIWLAAGRITDAKDYPNLLHAFALVHTKSPRTQLWIAGEAGDPAQAEHLRRLAAELPIGDCTKYLGLRRDIPGVLDGADAFVLSSAWEGMPLVIGEAMAMEKPVVATDVGGVHELVGGAGTLVPPRNAEQLAAAMLSVMYAPLGERIAQGRAARARILEHFSMDAKADAWESLYRSLIRR